MPESDTELIKKAVIELDSAFFGISVRAWLVIMLAGTVCFNQAIVIVGIVLDAVLNKDWSKVGTFANIGEPLYSLSLIGVGFYFGHQKTKQQ